MSLLSGMRLFGGLGSGRCMRALVLRRASENAVQIGIELRHAVSRAAREHFRKRWRTQNLVPFALALGPSLGAIRTRAQHQLARPVETFSEPGDADVVRSEGRRVGQAWGSPCRSRWSPYH